MEDSIAVLGLRVDTLETRLDDMSEKTVNKELHTAEYRNLERRIDSLENTLKTILFLTVTNLLAGTGFLAWQFISKG